MGKGKVGELEAAEEMEEEEEEMEGTWEVDIGGQNWVRYDIATEDALFAAKESGERFIHFSARSQDYKVDLVAMQQINVRTRATRQIRYVEVPCNVDNVLY